MITFPKELPEENLIAREAIFNGEAYLANPTSDSQKLVSKIRNLIKEELQVQDIRTAHKELSDEDFFNSMGNLRRTLYLEEEYHEDLRGVLESYHFDSKKCAFDPIRIRVVLPGGHHNIKAAPVYYAHRDTWYAHPQSLIVGWIPLDDLREEETFEFFPDYFNSVVPNNSEIFDYADWIKDGPALKIGWQKESSGIEGGYPKADSNHNPGERIRFAPKKAESLFFAGSHYHQTLEQDFDTIRYSIDFRVVHLDDLTTLRGSPNCDNRSRGDIVKDYIHP